MTNVFDYSLYVVCQLHLSLFSFSISFSISPFLLLLNLHTIFPHLLLCWSHLCPLFYHAVYLSPIATPKLSYFLPLHTAIYQSAQAEQDPLSQRGSWLNKKIFCILVCFAFAIGTQNQNTRVGNDYTIFVQLYAPIVSEVVSNRWGMREIWFGWITS